MTAANGKLTEVDHALVNRALIAATHEMGIKLIRSAHSPIVLRRRTVRPPSPTGRGEVVAQSELIAIQLGSITQTLAPCLELYPPETLREGDFFINNDPTMAASTSLTFSCFRRSFKPAH